MDNIILFFDTKDYVRFIKSMRWFNNINPIGSIYQKNYSERNGPGSQLGTGSLFKPLVEFIYYCIIKDRNLNRLLIEN